MTFRSILPLSGLITLFCFSIAYPQTNNAFQSYHIDSLNELRSILEEHSEVTSTKEKPRSRSAITVQMYKNSVLISPKADSSSSNFVALNCYCQPKGDSLELIVSIGFFAGVGFRILIFEDKFYSHYFAHDDEFDSFLQNPVDSTYSSNLTVDMKTQSLVLDAHPRLKSQPIKGKLSFQTQPFFAKKSPDNDTLNELWLKGTVFFECYWGE